MTRRVRMSPSEVQGWETKEWKETRDLMMQCGFDKHQAEAIADYRIHGITCPRLPARNT